MAKLNIQIKTFGGSILFEYATEGNSVYKTIEKAVLEGADLRGAYLRGAYLEGASLRGADLEGANLRGASLRGADLEGADLRGANLRDAYLEGASLRGADLEGANLRGASLRGVKNIPQSYINLCSRDMLFIFQSLKTELPYLRQHLIDGKIDGTQYEGECACLIGSLANSKNENLNKTCEYIPFYDKGLHNPAEQWFFQIREGDTPENNTFAKHVLELIDFVLKSN